MRADKSAAEQACIMCLAAYDLAFANELKELWLEYEVQSSPESRWVKVLDRFLPFVINLITGGQTWRDQAITRAQVLQINEPVKREAPELYAWMLQRIDESVRRGWLMEA